MGKGKKALLVFDGAMSEPQVFVNGEKVGEWKYGYAYFYFDITNFLKGGEENLLAVRLENKGESSRWYPGAGLYRKVQLIIKDDTNFQQWGTFITTPFVRITSYNVCYTKLLRIIMVTQFNSFIRPAIIIATVLFSTIGVFLGLGIFQMEFVVIMTGIGIISLAGIVVNNGIVLIDYISYNFV